MLEDFLAYTKESDLIQRGNKVLVGVSGGIDSVVLLNILIKLQKKLDIQISVAHINYGLREDSDRDNEFVKDLAAKHGLAFFDKKVKLSGSNIEEKARDIRYGFFNKIANQKGLGKIAVAHHKNDLVETFFLNAARGSGLMGLASMRPQSNALIRPLLFTTRREIEKYVEQNKLVFVEDVTNKDLSIKRNLIRYKIIPELEKVNPKLVETVAEEIQTLREVADILAQMTEGGYTKVAKEGKRSVTLTVSKLQNLHPYLQAEILRRSLRHVKGDLKDISRKNIQNILNLFEKPYGTKKVKLPSRLIAVRTYDKIKLEKETKSPAKRPKTVRLKMDKVIAFGKWRLFLSKMDGKERKADRNLVFLDIQKTPTLLVRCRKPGDKIKISKGKTKSLQNLFVDAKVPKDDRDAYPIVATKSGEIVWVPKLRVNPDYSSLSGEKTLVIKGERQNIEEE